MGIYWNCLLQAFSEHWIQPAPQGTRAFFCPQRQQLAPQMRKQGKKCMFYRGGDEIGRLRRHPQPARKGGAKPPRAAPDGFKRGAANRSPAPFAAVREKSAPTAGRPSAGGVPKSAPARSGSRWSPVRSEE